MTELALVPACDVCGQPTRDPHEPHDRGCPQTGDCGCDNVTCPGCCWDCETTPVTAWATAADLRNMNDADQLEGQDAMSGRWRPILDGYWDDCVIEVRWRKRPGVHADQPHWTVEHQAGRSEDKAWWGPDEKGCFSDFDILWAGGPESDQARAALVRAVRDAAEVPALRTHATTLQQARELAQDARDASMDATGPEAFDAAVSALLDLLTGETDAAQPPDFSKPAAWEQIDTILRGDDA